MTNTLPQRVAKIDDATASTIVRLELRGISQSEIARVCKVGRHAVKRVLDRTKAARAISEDVAIERGRALAVYREVQRMAWQAAEKSMAAGRSPAMLLAEIRMAQQRIDTVLGLAAAKPAEASSLTLLFDALREPVPYRSIAHDG